MSIRIKVHITLLLSVFLSGCGLFGGDEDDNEFAGLSTEAQFYERALDQLNGQNFRAAISTYQALESRFPFGRYAEQAQIEICLLYTSPSPRDATLSRMPSSA